MPDALAQIWITDNSLKEEDWLVHGYKTLAEYVNGLANEGDSVTIRKYSYLPLCTFGTFNTKTGEKKIVLTCKTEQDLPTVTVKGIVEFMDKKTQESLGVEGMQVASEAVVDVQAEVSAIKENE